jgi:hypothetical protein
MAGEEVGWPRVNWSEIAEAPQADVDFIANAPSDIAYLLAENERLRAVVEAAREMVAWMDRYQEHNDQCHMQPIACPPLSPLRAALSTLTPEGGEE